MEMQPRDTDAVLGGIDLPIEGAMVLGGFDAPKISELAREGVNAPFGKWAALKVPKGSDFFSKLSLRQLEKLVPYYNRDKIIRLWLERCRRDRLNEEFSDRDRSSCYRWYLRGLPLELAVLKVCVDRSARQNGS